MGTCVSWVPRLTAKIYVVHDPFDSAFTTASTDLLLKSNATGIRRKVTFYGC